MTVNELKKIIRNYINNEYSVIIERNTMLSTNGLAEYNRLIRNQVLDLAGIYIWENVDNGEILYIGMAGKINQQGILGNHSVRKRLQAARGRDTLTNEFIRNLMVQQNINLFNIHVIHLQNGQIPGYIEAVLINAFYQTNGMLPRYNNAY